MIGSDFGRISVEFRSDSDRILVGFLLDYLSGFLLNFYRIQADSIGFDRIPVGFRSDFGRISVGFPQHFTRMADVANLPGSARIRPDPPGSGILRFARIRSDFLHSGRIAIRPDPEESAPIGSDSLAQNPTGLQKIRPDSKNGIRPISVGFRSEFRAEFRSNPRGG